MLQGPSSWQHIFIKEQHKIRRLQNNWIHCACSDIETQKKLTEPRWKAKESILSSSLNRADPATDMVKRERSDEKSLIIDGGRPTFPWLKGTILKINLTQTQFISSLFQHLHSRLQIFLKNEIRILIVMLLNSIQYHGSNCI